MSKLSNKELLAKVGKSLLINPGTPGESIVVTLDPQDVFARKLGIPKPKHGANTSKTLVKVLWTTVYGKRNANQVKWLRINWETARAATEADIKKHKLIAIVAKGTKK